MSLIVFDVLFRRYSEKKCSSIYPKKSHQFLLDHVQELFPSDYFQELWIYPVVSCPQQFWLFGFLAVEILSEINPGVLPRNCFGDFFSDNSSGIHPTISRNFFLISTRNSYRDLPKIRLEFLKRLLWISSSNFWKVLPEFHREFLRIASIVSPGFFPKFLKQ